MSYIDHNSHSSLIRGSKTCFRPLFFNQGPLFVYAYSYGFATPGNDGMCSTQWEYKKFRCLIVEMILGHSNSPIESEFGAFSGDMSWCQFHILVQNLHLTSAVLNADLRCDDNNSVVERSVSLSLL